jgi:exosortase/archaeosortase family protein
VSRQWASVVLRLGFTFVTVWVGFLLLVNPWRRAEATGITGVLHAAGADRVRDGYGNQILVIPWTQRPFLATISPSCSAVAAVLAFGAVAMFLVKGSAHRRLLAFLGASAFIVVCNVLRIAASILVGIDAGARGLVLFHDWAGTLLGLIALLGGFVIFVFIQLPSTKTLLKEATRAA